MGCLIPSDEARHAAVAAEKAILFVEARLPEIEDLFAIEKANNAIRDARLAILAVDRAIMNVVRTAHLLDEARATLEEAKCAARKASAIAFSSTPVVPSDIEEIDDTDY